MEDAQAARLGQLQVEMSLSSHTAPHHPLPLPRHLPHPGICPICRNLLYSHRRAVFPRVCFVSPPGFSRSRAHVLPLFLVYIFNDFCQTNYLNTYGYR